MSENIVFISYAREDARHAERLYNDLRLAKINAWLDTRCLLPGSNWKNEIKKAIKNASYFIALLSAHSIAKRGVVQVELKEALKVFLEIPTNQIFIIPVRIDDCHPIDEELKLINWVDLFPKYQDGLQRIMDVFSNDVRTHPIENYLAGSTSARSPIKYSPYRAFSEFARDFIERLPHSGSHFDPNHPIYIRYKTDLNGVILPTRLKELYPNEMTVILQHRFESLTPERESFKLVLWFSGGPTTLTIPYQAISEISVPSIGIRMENCS